MVEQLPKLPTLKTDVIELDIPEKLYFTIGEVADLCQVKTHILRYWEQEFPQLQPTKRRGNRRYYQRKDILLVKQIKALLYSQGYTLEGARNQLTGCNKHELRNKHSEPATLMPHNKLIHELEEVLDLLV